MAVSGLSGGLLSFFFFSFVFAYEAPQAEPFDLNNILKQMRDAEVSIQEELIKIKRIYNQLDPLTKEEAQQLERKLGAEFAQLHWQVLRLQNEDPKSKVLPELKEKTREMFRSALAVALKVQTPVLKTERWINENPKAFHFLFDCLVVATAIVGADMSMKGDPSLLNALIVGGISSVVAIASIIFPAKWLSRYHQKKVVEDLFLSFLEGAHRAPIKLEKMKPAAAIEAIGQSMKYPRNFYPCLLSLKKLASAS